MTVVTMNILTKILQTTGPAFDTVNGVKKEDEVAVLFSGDVKILDVLPTSHALWLPIIQTLTKKISENLKLLP